MSSAGDVSPSSNGSPAVEPDVAERVLAQLTQRGGEFGELYAEQRSSLSISLDESKLEPITVGRDGGVGLRLVQGEATFYGYVDSFAEADLLQLADTVGAAAKAGAGATVALSAPQAAKPQLIERRPEDVDTDAKATILRSCNERARAHDAAIEQVAVGYAESRRFVTVFNTEGVAASDDRTRLRLSVQAVAKRDGRIETGTETRGGHRGFELLGDDPDRVALSAASKAVAMLDAADAPAGRMPVVVGNGFGGVLLHEAVGHGLESDAVQKGASVYAGRIGDQLAAEFINAFDDGRLPGEWGTDGIDDEGFATQKTPIIENGILTSYLYDWLRARKDGVTSTGNGRRESFRHLPIPRMTNTYFAPGTSRPEDLISSVERGLYAVSFGGGQVEPATGDFVFGVSEGYLIENGKVTAPVRGVTLTGNGIEALAAVEAVADDLEIATGFCGKAGQRVAAGVGQPHVLIRELTVGGMSS